MTDFSMTFSAGLASGVVLAVLGYFVRLLLQRRSRGGPMIELSMEKLRPLIPIVVGFIIFFVGVYMWRTGEVFGLPLIVVSAVIILTSAVMASH